MSVFKGSKFPHFNFFPENPKNILHYFRMSLFHIPGETFDKFSVVYTDYIVTCIGVDDNGNLRGFL